MILNILQGLFWAIFLSAVGYGYWFMFFGKEKENEVTDKEIYDYVNKQKLMRSK